MPSGGRVRRLHRIEQELEPTDHTLSEFELAGWDIDVVLVGHKEPTKVIRLEPCEFDRIPFETIDEPRDPPRGDLIDRQERVETVD